jgi:hypothetical protein
MVIFPATTRRRLTSKDERWANIRNLDSRNSASSWMIAALLLVVFPAKSNDNALILLQ